MFFNESYDNQSLNVQASETGLTPDMAGVYQMIAESSEEWYNLREKMMKVEHVSIIREDAELLQEGSREFFGKISGFFKRMLAKIKELWAKFIAFINKATMGDKEFVTKYEKLIRNNNLSGFEVTARNWKSGKLGAELNFPAVVSMVNGLFGNISKSGSGTSSLKEKYQGDDWDKEVRKAIVGGSGDAGDFKSDIQKSFTNGGDTDKVELSYAKLDLSNMFAMIKDSGKNVEAAQKEEKAVEKMLEDSAKFFDRIHSDLGDESKGSDAGGGMTSHPVKRDASAAHSGEATGGSYAARGEVKSYVGSHKDDKGQSNERLNKREAASIIAGAARKASTISSQAFGELISSIRERRGEYRSIVAKMATYRGSAKSEGYDFMSESTSSILDRF